MSHCADEAAAGNCSGQSVVSTVATAVTSELVAALTAVQSVTSVAAADPPAVAVATKHHSDAPSTTDMAPVSDVTSPPTVRNKSQTSRKRCRPTEARPSIHLSLSETYRRACV